METSFPTRIGKEPCNNGLIIHGDAARVRYSLVLPSERSTGREGTCTWRVLENASVASLPGRGRCYFVTNSALLFRTVPLDVSPHFRFHGDAATSLAIPPRSVYRVASCIR